MESRIPDEISLTRRARSRCSAKLRARTRTSLSCWAAHTRGHGRSPSIDDIKNLLLVRTKHSVYKMYAFCDWGLVSCYHDISWDTVQPHCGPDHTPAAPERTTRGGGSIINRWNQKHVAGSNQAHIVISLALWRRPCGAALNSVVDYVEVFHPVEQCGAVFRGAFFLPAFSEGDVSLSIWFY